MGFDNGMIENGDVAFFTGHDVYLLSFIMLWGLSLIRADSAIDTTQMATAIPQNTYYTISSDAFYSQSKGNVMSESITNGIVEEYETRWYFANFCNT